MLMSFSLLYWPVGTTTMRLKPSVGSGLRVLNSFTDSAGPPMRLTTKRRRMSPSPERVIDWYVSPTFPSTDAQTYGTTTATDEIRPKRLNVCPYPPTTPLMKARTSEKGREGSKRTSPDWYE